MIIIYRVLTNILYPLFVIIIFIRKFINKEHHFRYREKIFPSLLNYQKDRNKKLLWFHASSIGEFKSIIPIITELNKEKKKFDFLITTTTLSSGNLAELEFKKFNNVFHRFFPIDVSFVVKKFISIWKPDFIFLVDSEIWPNLIFHSKNKRIPLAILNARITKKTFKRWMLISSTAKKIFNSFDLCLVANDETKNYLEELNVKKIKNQGNLKLINNSNFEKFKNVNEKFLKTGLYWLASSTHAGEEAFCIKVHLKIKKSMGNVITIIAPRHISRVNDIQKLCQNLNLKSQILAENEIISKNSEIIIINSYGFLKDFYKFSKSVFMGKSILKRIEGKSGQSPIEPAQLGCKVYHGPYIYNFSDIYEILKNHGISQLIKNSEDLARNIVIDFNNTDLNERKFSIIMDKLSQKTLDDTMQTIKKFISYENI